MEKQRLFYGFQQSHFRKKLEFILDKFDFEVVVYDETEIFRDFNDDLFMYPY